MDENALKPVQAGAIKLSRKDQRVTLEDMGAASTESDAPPLEA